MRVLQVEMSSEGILAMVRTSAEMAGTWCEYACAARDRHEQNMEVFLTEEEEDTAVMLGEAAGGCRAAVMVRTTRTVRRGDELLVWFEDSLARQRNVPILTLANIRGLLHVSKRPTRNLCRREVCNPNDCKCVMSKCYFN